LFPSYGARPRLGTPCIGPKARNAMEIRMHGQVASTNKYISLTRTIDKCGAVWVPPRRTVSVRCNTVAPDPSAPLRAGLRVRRARLHGVETSDSEVRRYGSGAFEGFCAGLLSCFGWRRLDQLGIE